MTQRVLIPLPSQGFEPTEVAVPWRVLRSRDVEVVFATPDGRPGECDPLALEGVVFGQIGATAADAASYREMSADPAFRDPIPYEAIDVSDYEALHLPGGHAPGMIPYLESACLQQKAAEFFIADKLVSAVCHGPIVLARAVDPRSGRSLLAGRRVTALTRLLERIGYLLTVWTLGKHFRTYPEYVEDEVATAIGEGAKFERGPLFGAFVVEDGKLITARWPGDVPLLAEKLHERLAGESDHEPRAQ